MKAPDRTTYRTRALSWLLRGFFRLLYNQFAWTYDWVAWIVSLGRWNEWILTSIPFLDADPILEIGHGTGHLQLALAKLGRQAIGLDISAPMGKIARKRLLKKSIPPVLVEGAGSSIPFSTDSIASVVATFPSEYISNRQTLEETWRVLRAGGRLVILPYAWITGDRFLDRLAGWLFRITDQAPVIPVDEEAPSGIFGGWIQELVRNAEQIGYQVATEIVHLHSSRVLMIVANKEINSTRKFSQHHPAGVK